MGSSSNIQDTAGGISRTSWKEFELAYNKWSADNNLIITGMPDKKNYPPGYLIMCLLGAKHANDPDYPVSWSYTTPKIMSSSGSGISLIDEYLLYSDLCADGLYAQNTPYVKPMSCQAFSNICCPIWDEVGKNRTFTDDWNDSLSEMKNTFQKFAEEAFIWGAVLFEQYVIKELSFERVAYRNISSSVGKTKNGSLISKQLAADALNVSKATSQAFNPRSYLDMVENDLITYGFIRRETDLLKSVYDKNQTAVINDILDSIYLKNVKRDRLQSGVISEETKKLRAGYEARKNTLLKGLEITDKTSKLYRVTSQAEYDDIMINGGKFVSYDYAMEQKWFATTQVDAVKWGKLFYPDGNYKLIEIEVPTSSLSQMYYLPRLDGIGPAYCVEIDLINSILKGLKLIP